MNLTLGRGPSPALPRQGGRVDDQKVTQARREIELTQNRDVVDRIAIDLVGQGELLLGDVGCKNDKAPATPAAGDEVRIDIHDDKAAPAGPASDQVEITVRDPLKPSEAPVKIVLKQGQFQAMMKYAGWVGVREFVASMLGVVAAGGYNASVRTMVSAAYGVSPALGIGVSAVVTVAEVGALVKFGYLDRFREAAKQYTTAFKSFLSCPTGREALRVAPMLLSVGAAVATGVLRAPLMGMDVFRKQVSRLLGGAVVRDLVGKSITKNVGPTAKMVPGPGLDGKAWTASDIREAEGTKMYVGFLLRILGGAIAEYVIRPRIATVQAGGSSVPPFVKEPGTPARETFGAELTNDLSIGTSSAVATFIAAVVGNMASGIVAERKGIPVEYTPGEGLPRLFKNICETIKHPLKAWEEAYPDHCARALLIGLTGALGDTLVECAPGEAPNWAAGDVGEPEDAGVSVAMGVRMVLRTLNELRGPAVERAKVELKKVEDALKTFAECERVEAELGRIGEELARLEKQGDGVGIEPGDVEKIESLLDEADALAEDRHRLEAAIPGATQVLQALWDPEAEAPELTARDTKAREQPGPLEALPVVEESAAEMLDEKGSAPKGEPREVELSLVSRASGEFAPMHVPVKRTCSLIRPDFPGKVRLDEFLRGERVRVDLSDDGGVFTANFVEAGEGVVTVGYPSNTHVPQPIVDASIGGEQRVEGAVYGRQFILKVRVG